MISLILPYWDRQEAADRALASIARAYPDLNLEVVVIDDGNAIPFRVPDVALNIRVLTLPRKGEPTSCIHAWNEGVRFARGEIIVLSCVEVIHDKPVLGAMAEQVRAEGPNAYVLAAAWCPELQEWHCHSSGGAGGAHPIPKGTGRSFCGAMHRALFERAGGFDEDYMCGAGYEDCDFIQRMLAAGARFTVRDDLVVTHPKAGASIAWPAGAFERNRAIFERKWANREHINVVCVNAQNYCGRGAEYVNVLFDAVCAHMPPGVPFTFWCITDDVAGLHPHVKTLALPRGIAGWWGKIFMFKRGLFPDGARCVFFDLDTLIVGRLDDVCAYRGEMAILQDFYYPERGAPGVVLWRAGAFTASIYAEWDACGKPTDGLGDLDWIENLDQGRFTRKLDRLQKLFPEQFVSYKAHCERGLPAGARVVCFHGTPRPHEARDEWVRMAWQVGGRVPARFQVLANTRLEQVAENIRLSCALDLPWLEMVPPHDGTVAICGGGPSLTRNLDELRAFEGEIYACNNAYGFLEDNGVFPHAQVIIDAREDNVRFVREATRYFLASQCAPAVFAAARGRVTVVHMNTAHVLDAIPLSMKPVNLISSGTTVGLAALAIAYVQGYRKFTIYGMESSYADDAHHAYGQAENDGDRVIDAVCGGLTFKTTPWMIKQVENFQKLSVELAQDGCEIDVRCGGLLGHVAWLMAHDDGSLPAQHAA